MKYVRLDKDGCVIGAAEGSSLPPRDPEFDYLQYDGELSTEELACGPTMIYVNVDGELVDSGEPRFASKPDQTWNRQTGKWEEHRPVEVQKAETAAILRERRGKLLADSDWTQLPDTRLTGPQRAEWVQYRNELRDLPQTYEWATDIEDVEWPTPPN